MKDFRSAAQQYLVDKGHKSEYTFLEVVTMLDEFAKEQIPNSASVFLEARVSDYDKFKNYYEK